MKVLSINSGSSSIKFKLFEMQSGTTLASGLAEKIGDSSCRQSYVLHGDTDQETTSNSTIANHQQGLADISTWLTASGVIANASELLGVGHRVAHGGAEFTEPTLVNDQVLAAIKQLIPLAPLHNPANLLGLEVTMALWPETPQVAVFDTAFHHTLPDYAHQYAVPAELAQQHHIRRYGFHGTSHKYVAGEAAKLIGKPLGETNLIVLHLGNGASATAICNGQSVDTSMGMTPLEGLIMGTRSGDLDPGVIFYLARVTGMPATEIDATLNQASGLQGVCGRSDMREVLRQAEAGDNQATLALEMYTYRIKKYIGAYAAVLPRLDAIVFTAGIGEHSSEIRERVSSDLEHLGISLCRQRNSTASNTGRTIHQDNSSTQILVIPTDEELEIANSTLQCIDQLT